MCLFSRAEAVLRHIAELNPYVHVSSSSAPFDETTDLSFLEKYQVSILYCVIDRVQGGNITRLA